MDSNIQEEQYQEDVLPRDVVQYNEENTSQVDYDRREELTRKRYPVTRSGNNPGRVKRVVSCKRKTHHLAVVRKKQPVSARSQDMGNKENEMTVMEATQEEVFHMDPWEFPTNVNNHQSGGTGSKYTDCITLPEITRDHSAMINVLCGRNLRLKVALTLWQRNVGELLTYFLRMQDTGVVVDFLPIITKSIEEDSSNVTIGCCVDLLPFVKKVLSSPYEEYIVVGLKWINAVLRKWWYELRATGHSGRINKHMDKNFQVFNQQLLNLWHQEPYLKLVQTMPGDLAKVIDSFLSQLT